MSIQLTDNNSGNKHDNDSGSNKETLVKTPFSIEHILCSNNNENSFSLKSFQKIHHQKSNPVNLSENRSIKIPNRDDEDYQRIMNSQRWVVSFKICLCVPSAVGVCSMDFVRKYYLLFGVDYNNSEIC